MHSAKFNIGLTMATEIIEEMSKLSLYLNQSRGVTFTEGEGPDQINLIFHDQRELPDGESETLDFHNGTVNGGEPGELKNKIGQLITMDKFKALYVKNNSTDSTLILGNAGGNDLELFGAAAHTHKIRPGGDCLLTAPDADGIDCETNAKLKFEHGGEGTDAPKYDLIAAGVDLA